MQRVCGYGVPIRSHSDNWFLSAVRFSQHSEVVLKKTMKYTQRHIARSIPMLR
jgi:hypothetical protein